jgi:hypothetical protein
MIGGSGHLMPVKYSWLCPAGTPTNALNTIATQDCLTNMMIYPGVRICHPLPPHGDFR